MNDAYARMHNDYFIDKSLGRIFVNIRSEFNEQK